MLCPQNQILATHFALSHLALISTNENPLLPNVWGFFTWISVALLA